MDCLKCHGCTASVSRFYAVVMKPRSISWERASPGDDTATTTLDYQMVNKYRRKTEQASWDEESMKKALQEVIEQKASIKGTAKKYNIPRTTLQRHLLSGVEKRKLGRFTTVFTPEQETELLEYVFHMDNLFYGLSKTEFLKLVYEYADLNKVKNPFKNGSAGIDWYKGFVSRHPELTLRKPEPTSIARARGFNKPQVYRFFDLLEEQIEKHGVDATCLYNMDETGIQTSTNKPPKVLSKTGKRQVGLISSTERGRTTTVICCCNAAGSFVPPFLIFARKKMNDRLLDGAPPGAQATCSDNGWINGPVFLKWLQFFVENVRPTIDKKVILVLDNHESHKFLPALEYASQHNVIFVSLAPHTTHKMQPLDVCVYGPLKVYFEQAIATFQKAHAGRIINQNDIAQLFSGAYMKAATTQNAVNGFKYSGLFPTDRYTFDEADFLPATVTENAIDTVPPNDLQPSLQSINDELDRTPSPSVIEQMIQTLSTNPSDSLLDQMIHLSGPEILISTSSVNPTTTLPPTIESRPETPLSQQIVAPVGTAPKPSTSNEPVTAAVIQEGPSTSGLHHSPMMVRPLPKVAPKKTNQKRKIQKAEVLTSTPIKEQQRKKMAQKLKVDERKINATKKKLDLLSQKKTNPKRKNTNAENKKSKNVNCIICNEKYENPPVEDWIRCDDCRLWAHEACTSYCGIGSYYCDHCQEI